MKSAKIRLALVFICMLLLGITFLLDIVGGIVPAGLIAGAVGFPVVSNDYPEYHCTDITQIITDENYLYVASGHKSIVQVFTLDGTYVRTISVYNYNNGRMELALKDDVLYIRDKHHNLYLFSDGELLEYLDRSAPAQISLTVPFGAYDSSYFVRNGSVWKHMEERGSVCIVEVPPVFGFYQNATSWKIKFALMLIIGYTLYLFPTKRKAKP